MLFAVIRFLCVIEYISQTFLTLRTVFAVSCECPGIIEGPAAEAFLTVTRRNHWEVPDNR